MVGHLVLCFALEVRVLAEGGAVPLAVHGDVGGVQVDDHLLPELGLDGLDLLDESHHDIAEVGGAVVGQGAVHEGQELLALEQGDEAPEDAGGCEVGGRCLALDGFHAAAHDGAGHALVVDLDGQLEDDPLDEGPLHGVGALAVQIIEVAVLQLLHILEQDLGHGVVDDGLLRQELGAALEHFASLVGLGDLGQEDVGDDLAALDVGHRGEDVGQGRQGDDARDEHIAADVELTGADLGVAGQSGEIHGALTDGGQEAGFLQFGVAGGEPFGVGGHVGLQGVAVSLGRGAGDLAFHQDPVVALGGGVERVLDAEGSLGSVETGHGYGSHDGGLGLGFLALCAHLGDGLLQVGDGAQDLGLSFRSLGLFGGDFHTQLLGDGREGCLEGGVLLGGLLLGLELRLVGVKGALAVDFVVLRDNLLLLFGRQGFVGEFGLEAQLLGHGLQPGNKFLHY